MGDEHRSQILQRLADQYRLRSLLRDRALPQPDQQRDQESGPDSSEQQLVPQDSKRLQERYPERSQGKHVILRLVAMMYCKDYGKRLIVF